MAQLWYGKRGDLRFGPWSVQELKVAVASGVIEPDDLVRTAEKDRWVRAGDVKGLAFGTNPFKPEPIQEPKSPYPTSPERRQLPPLATETKSGPPPLPSLPRSPFGQPTKTPKPVLLVGICILGLLLVYWFGGSVTENWKSPTAGDSIVGATTAESDDISDDDLKGIYQGMADKDFQKIIGKLWRPTLTGRQIPAPRFSCKHMAAWKKKDGFYLLLHWLESTDPRTGEKRIVNFRTWDNQTLRQVEDLKLFLK